MKEYLFIIGEYEEANNIEKENFEQDLLTFYNIYEVGKEVPVQEHLNLLSDLLTVNEDDEGLYVQATYDNTKKIFNSIVERIGEEFEILKKSSSDQYLLNLNKMAQTVGMSNHKTILINGDDLNIYYLDAFAIYGSHPQVKYYIKKCFEYEREIV